jgi:CHAT domain-containing protein
LAALQLKADLVVVSACRSAGGVLVGGEGVQGLTSPLLQAGARSLVATMWRIPDLGVVKFIDDFYAALARGLPVADAMRSAKLSALKAGEAPRIWAAFNAIGDPLVVVPLRPPRKPWWSAIFPTRP